MISTTTAGSAPLSGDEADLQRGRPAHFAAWEVGAVRDGGSGRVSVSRMNAAPEVAGRVVA